MRVIVWGINYTPELTGIAPFNTGLCDFLRARGHQVEMVTTFPYYPFWRKLPGDERRLYRTDDLDGVWVHRCWHYVPSRVSTLKRMGHELSFGVTSFLRVLFLSRPDVYVIVSPPLMLGPLAKVISVIKRRPYVFHVQDLQPDAAVGLGMVKPGRFTRLLYRIEAFSYRHARAVSGISDGMIAAFTRKGVPAAKRLLFPNWLRWYGRNADAADLREDRSKHAAAFRKKYGIPEDAFLASYSGNLGRKQGLDALIEAASVLATSTDPAAKRIHLLIVGDGVMRRELEQQIASRSLKNIRMMPLLTEVDYHGMVAASAVSLILQSPGTGQYFFPSKLLSVLSMRAPVISAADDDSELAKAVNAGGFGINVPCAAPGDLASALIRLTRDPSQLDRCRDATAWVDRFSASIVLKAYEQRLLEVSARIHPI